MGEFSNLRLGLSRIDGRSAGSSIARTWAGHLALLSQFGVGALGVEEL